MNVHHLAGLSSPGVSLERRKIICLYTKCCKFVFRDGPRCYVTSKMELFATIFHEVAVLLDMTLILEKDLVYYLKYHA